MDLEVFQPKFFKIDSKSQIFRHKQLKENKLTLLLATIS